MNRTLRAAIFAAIAVPATSQAAVVGIQLDGSGMGNVGNSVIRDNIGGFEGHVLIRDGVPAGTSPSAELWAMNAYEVTIKNAAGVDVVGILSYELKIPVITSVPLGGAPGTNLRVTNAEAGGAGELGGELAHARLALVLRAAVRVKLRDHRALLVTALPRRAARAR